MKRDSALIPLKDIINSLKKGKLPFDLNDGKIWVLWKDIVGSEISEHARPAWVRNKTLMVHVSSPIWAQELRYRETDIKTRLNDLLGRTAINEIRFKVR